MFAGFRWFSLSDGQTAGHTLKEINDKFLLLFRQNNHFMMSTWVLESYNGHDLMLVLLHWINVYNEHSYVEPHLIICLLAHGCTKSAEKEYFCALSLASISVDTLPCSPITTYSCFSLFPQDTRGSGRSRLPGCREASLPGGPANQSQAEDPQLPEAHWGR